MPGVVDGDRSNAFHFASPRVCHVINSVIGGTLGFQKSRIGQESSQESFQKERFGLLGSVSRKRSLTSENVSKCYAAFCVSSALSRRRSPVRIRSELPANPKPRIAGFWICRQLGPDESQRFDYGGTLKAHRRLRRGPRLLQRAARRPSGLPRSGNPRSLDASESGRSYQKPQVSQLRGWPFFLTGAHSQESFLARFQYLDRALAVNPHYAVAIGFRQLFRQPTVYFFVIRNRQCSAPRNTVSMISTSKSLLGSRRPRMYRMLCLEQLH